MKLSENEFNEWCRKNQISAEAKLIIQRIRTSEPSRRVKSGPWSVSGTFPSRKMGVTIQYESHKNELPFILELEHDPEVLEFYDQPCQIKLNYLSKKGRNTGALHTPDFFVIRRSEAVFFECKTEDDLLELTLKTPARYQLDETGSWICPPGKEYAEPLGLDYYLRSSKEIGWIFQRNIEFLDDYYRNNNFHSDKEEYIEILEIVKHNPAITLEHLFQKIEKINASSRDDVHNLIVRDAIYVDLHSQLLTEPKTVCLYANKEVAIAYANLALTITQSGDELLRPNKVNLSVNKEVLWDGKAWKIVNIGESEITLIDENNNISEIKLILFEKFILSGKVQSLSESGERDLQEHINIILEASQEALAEANYRLKYVLAHLNNEVNEEPLPVCEKTLKRWINAYLDAQMIFGRGYYGLIPKPNKGNRCVKIDVESKTLLESFINKDFENLIGKNKKTVHEAYQYECEKRGIITASYKTFCSYVNNRPQYEQTLKRKGKRAAYQYEEFIWILEQDTPRHGERPFHIAHLDHTELDIELIDSKTGKNLGRPQLTFLIDAFSRRILALYLTFNAPSKISCMMLLRECVRRHGRLPQILVVDGGKDFSSTYFEQLLATYEITRKTRPPAKSRYGAVIERLFGTNNTQFVHNLQGNTKITKNVRQFTKSNNPKNLAVWDLGMFFNRLSEWTYSVYDQTIHSTLGETPQAAFARGILQSGERSNTYIPFDEAFIFMTLPGSRKGKAKIDHVNGVKINTIFYWSQEFRRPGVAGKSVPVKYDPFDMGSAYAFVNGKWRKCISGHQKALGGRSQREVYIATEELKKRLKVSSVPTSRLAAFMNSVEADEVLLKQRMIDREQRPILQLINGGILSGNNSNEVQTIESTEPTLEFNKAENVIQFPLLTEIDDFEEDEQFTGYPVI